MNNNKKYLVTAALPYANGPIHIGHIAGNFLPADIFVRYLRLKGEDVIFISGSDEHGIPVTIKARQEGISTQEFVDKYHKLNKKDLEDFGISFDIFSRTSSEIHKEMASEFFKKLYDEGLLTCKESEQYYDEEAKQFLADRYIRGKCPKCGYEDAYGDQCEKCGISLTPNELINPHSYLSNNKPVLKKTKHWYLPLEKYQDWLKKWILEDHKEWKNNVYTQCKAWLDEGLKERPVTRDLNWGVKLPIENTEGKVLYVWFDAPIGYISFTKEFLGEKYKDYWCSKDTKLIHFIGKDNIVFHCIIFPVMLKIHGDYILPDNIPANEFMNLEGDKISTSRNHAVWLHDYLIQYKDNQDVLRYVLTVNMPENKDADFTWNDFKNKNNNELVATFGNFVNRTLSMINMYFNGNLSNITNFNSKDKGILDSVNNLINEIGKDIETYHFKDGINHWMEIARIGNKYLTEEEPWKKFKENKDRTKEILSICLKIVYKLSITGEPFLPFTSKKIFKMLGISDYNWNVSLNNDIDIKISKDNISLLFEKIE